MQNLIAVVLALFILNTSNAQDILKDRLGASLLHRIAPATPSAMQELFQPTSQPLPVVSAHRGGPDTGFPENCIATFENTLKHTFALLEIDPRYAKDGEIVVHHDATLERTSSGQGRVIDHTLSELKALKLKDVDGKETPFQIPTLNELIEWARGKTILVLDQKDVPATERVRQITKHHAEAYCMVIVNSFNDVKACYAINPSVMMEVMIPNIDKAKQFDQLGIPWRNVIAFVGHTPPEDLELYQFIRSRGASCMVGTSRNLDRKIITRQVTEIKELEADYRAFLDRGANILETDIPSKLGPLLYQSAANSSEKWNCLQVP
ncbi:MAG: glycerophosphodiester phosphodiesterase family protein [Pirellulaceae bacterium]|nr:glycerophosphodiester phosphodiesterase family protein [Pirellulaceae bacterium]